MSKIDLESSINSGQVFLWQNKDDIWYGINGQNVIKLQRKLSTLDAITADFTRYDDNIEQIIESISKDAIVKDAIAKYPGLCIFRQDPFQCLVSFIASSNSSIQKIRTCLTKLCKMYGERRTVDGEEFHVFPRPDSIADASVDDIAKSGTGYRSEFVKSAARMVSTGEIDLQKLRSTEYHKARDLICTVPGVGYKVADCVMLFSLEKLEAFPIDRWTSKILKDYYQGRFSFETKKTITKPQYDIIHQEIVDYFGPYAGYAQQFLFKMERDQRGKRW